MKRIGLIFLYILLFVGASLPLHAQAPYRHSLGATLGTTQALSYKTFPTNHFALQIDLGPKYCYVYGNHLWSLELAPNFMYEGRLKGNLYGFVGGGISWGYALKRYTYYDAYGMQSSNINLKGGVNGFFGLEYKFNIPLTLQFDFRPGFRGAFNQYFGEFCFDWGLNFGVRYTF